MHTRCPKLIAQAQRDVAAASALVQGAAADTGTAADVRLQALLVATQPTVLAIASLASEIGRVGGLLGAAMAGRSGDGGADGPHHEQAAAVLEELACYRRLLDGLTRSYGQLHITATAWIAERRVEAAHIAQQAAAAAIPRALRP